MRKLLLALAFLSVGLSEPSYAESQGNDYKGITDPFGDPANYEFAEDEKEDKEFFHLGKFLMLGVDIGGGVFTGGLGSSTDPAMYFGAHLVYFFDRSIAFEAAVHFSKHTDTFTGTDSNQYTIGVMMIPLTLGLRYYFDTRDAPKAIAISNPYLAFGGGGYLRDLSEDFPEGTKSHFGVYAGAGIEFLIYRKHVYLGLDLRYHMIFFGDEGSTFDGVVDPGARSGDFLSPAISLTYNF